MGYFSEAFGGHPPAPRLLLKKSPVNFSNDLLRTRKIFLSHENEASLRLVGAKPIGHWPFRFGWMQEVQMLFG